MPLDKDAGDKGAWKRFACLRMAYWVGGIGRYWMA